MSQPIGTVPVHRCRTCMGVWLEAGEFNELFIDADRQRDVLRHEPPRLAPKDSGAEVRCPRCRMVMVRRNFGRTSGILVDSCKRHGIWFDAGELRQVVEFLEQREAMAREDDAGLNAPPLAASQVPVPHDLDIAGLLPAEESLFERLLTRLTQIMKPREPRDDDPWRVF